MSTEWNHERVVLGLIERNEVIKDRIKKNGRLQKDINVKLYDQSQDCAILYFPSSRYKNRPLHLKRVPKVWSEDIWIKIKPFVDSEGSKTDPRGFDHYIVKDWNDFAKAIGLE